MNTYQNKKWLTVVELIIVMSILAILWSIAYITLIWNSENARDTTRIRDLKDIETSMELFLLEKNFLPKPSLWRPITYLWSEVWYQWTIWDSVITNLNKINTKLVDPYYKVEYTYSRSFLKDKFQLSSILEKEVIANNSFNEKKSILSSLIIPQTYAAKKVTWYVSWNYSWDRIPFSLLGKDYFMSLPSIILTSLTNPTININTPTYLVVSWLDNLPSSYSLEELSMTWSYVYYPKLLNKKIWVYYWIPSELNSFRNNSNISKVIIDFNKFDNIILWEWLEKVTNPDNANTTTILSWYTWKSYWYITMRGTATDIKTRVDEWETTWVTWIFLAESWYDYLVDQYVPISTKAQARNHQNDIINYIHWKWLKVIMDWTNPDDIFWTKAWEVASSLNNVNDWYLFAPFTYDSTNTPVYNYNSQWTKIETIKDYRDKYNFNINCVWKMNLNSDIWADEIKIIKWKADWLCNTIQLTNSNFSSWWIDNNIMTDFLK